MHRNTTTMIFAIVACAGSMAHADIVRVDPFSSDQGESFETLNMNVFHNGDVSAFGGAGSLYSVGDAGFLHTTGAWSYEQRVSAFDGDLLLGSNAGIGYSFDSHQRSFGGYFSSITDATNGEVRFYDGENLIGVDTLVAPTDQSWAWNGWSSDQSFDRIEISSNHLSFGYIMHDAIRVLSTATPAPGGLALMFGGALVIARRRR